MIYKCEFPFLQLLNESSDISAVPDLMEEDMKIWNRIQQTVTELQSWVGCMFIVAFSDVICFVIIFSCQNILLKVIICMFRVKCSSPMLVEHSCYCSFTRDW